MHEFEVAFTTITCDECGRTCFANEQPCGCEDSDGVGMDPHVLTRRRLIAAVPVPPALPRAPESLARPPDGVWDGLANLLEALLGAISCLAAEKKTGTDDLGVVLAELRDRRNMIREARLLRPWVATWRAVDSALSRIQQAASEYLHAIAADTAPEAERYAGAAQVAIDRVTELTSAYRRRIDLWVDVDDDSPDPLESLPGVVAAAFHDSEAETLVEFDREGWLLYERITGKTEGALGIGVALRVTQFAAAVIQDDERLWDKARTAYHLLSGHEQRLLALSRNDAWVAAYRRAMVELLDATTEAGVLSSAAFNDRLEARAIIGFGARLFEPVSRPLIVPLLTVPRGGNVERLLSRDPNQLIGQLRDAGFVELTEGFLAAVRDADAHNEFLLDESVINFTSKRAEIPSMSAAELLDSALMGLETLHALHHGLMCALVEAGLPVEHHPDSDVWGFTPEQQLALVLGMSGWISVQVVSEEGTLRAEGIGDFPQNPLSLGGSCLAVVGPGTSELVLGATGESGYHELRGPVEPFRKREESGDEWEREALFLEGGRRWTFDGEPIFSEDHARKWIAVKAGSVLQDRAVLRKLRTLLKLAERLDDGAMVASIAAAMRIARAQHTGVAADPADIDRLGLLIHWERRVL